MILLDELVLCKLCMALLTFDSRPHHIAWHARINAKLYKPPPDPALHSGGRSDQTNQTD